MAEDLAIDQQVMRQAGRRLRDLREGESRFAQVSGVERDPCGVAVELAADSVVLLLGPGRPAHPHHGLLAGRHGAGEHELDGIEERDLGQVQLHGPGPDGSLAEVTGEHVNPSHLGWGGFERLRDGLFDEAFPEADAKVRSEDVHNKSSYSRIEPGKEPGERLQFRLRSRRSLDGVKRIFDVDQSQRLRRRPACEHLGRPVARVRMLEVDTAELLGLEVRKPGDRSPHGAATEIQRPRVTGRERPRGHVQGRQAQLAGIQGHEVSGEEACLREF